MAGFARSFEREVGATPAEFRRGLALAHPGFVGFDGEGLRLEEGGVRLVVRLTQGPTRRLGLFELPVLWVGFDFEAGTPEECQALLARIDLAMQRGGG